MLNFSYTGKKEEINEAKANGSSGGADPEIKTFLGMQLHSDKLTDLDVMMFSKKLETMMKKKTSKKARHD